MLVSFQNVLQVHLYGDNIIYFFYVESSESHLPTSKMSLTIWIYQDTL